MKFFRIKYQFFHYFFQKNYLFILLLIFCRFILHLLDRFQNHFLIINFIRIFHGFCHLKKYFLFCIQYLLFLKYDQKYFRIFANQVQLINFFNFLFYLIIFLILLFFLLFFYIISKFLTNPIFLSINSLYFSLKDCYINLIFFTKK